MEGNERNKRKGRKRKYSNSKNGDGERQIVMWSKMRFFKMRSRKFFLVALSEWKTIGEDVNKSRMNKSRMNKKEKMWIEVEKENAIDSDNGN